MSANTNKTWAEFISYPFLSGFFQHYVPQAFKGLELFNFSNPKNTYTNTVKIRHYDNKTSDAIAKHTAPDAPAHKLKQGTRRIDTVEVLRVPLRYDFSESELEYFQDSGNVVSQADFDTVTGQMQNLKQEVMQVANDDTFDALADGTITLTEELGVYGTISFGSITNNTPNQGGWTDPNATIIQDVTDVKIALETAAKAPAKKMIINSLTEYYILNNDGVKSYKEFTDLNSQFINNGHIRRFMGLDIEVIDSVMYKSSTTKHVPDNKVTFVADVPDVLSFIKGYKLIPGADGKSVGTVQGEYAYTILSQDPVSLAVICGLNYIPYISKPECIQYLSWT